MCLFQLLIKVNGMSPSTACDLIQSFSFCRTVERGQAENPPEFIGLSSAESVYFTVPLDVGVIISNPQNWYKYRTCARALGHYMLSLLSNNNMDTPKGMVQAQIIFRLEIQTHNCTATGPCLNHKATMSLHRNSSTNHQNTHISQFFF